MPESGLPSNRLDTDTHGAAVTASSSHQSYRAARNLLLDLREDPDRAHAEFRWPDVGETFNWAVDWFDEMARDNDRPALVIVGEAGGWTRRSFDELARRSDQVAAWLAAQGVQRG